LVKEASVRKNLVSIFQEIDNYEQLLCVCRALQETEAKDLADYFLSLLNNDSRIEVRECALIALARRANQGVSQLDFDLSLLLRFFKLAAPLISSTLVLLVGHLMHLDNTSQNSVLIGYDLRVFNNKEFSSIQVSLDPTIWPSCRNIDKGLFCKIYGIKHISDISNGLNLAVSRPVISAPDGFV
jgi:hypothetical protein